MTGIIGGQNGRLHKSLNKAMIAGDYRNFPAGRADGFFRPLRGLLFHCAISPRPSRTKRRLSRFLSASATRYSQSRVAPFIENWLFRPLRADFYASRRCICWLLSGDRHSRFCASIFLCPALGNKPLMRSRLRPRVAINNSL